VTRARVAADACVSADGDGAVVDDDVVRMPRGVGQSHDAGVYALWRGVEQGWQ
jgi:hypothetical protein